jgi:hypothetical protein
MGYAKPQQFLKTRFARVDTSLETEITDLHTQTIPPWADRGSPFEERAMSEEIQEMQRQIVSAVQQELTRFSGEVATNLKKLSDEVATGAGARTELERQVQALAGALEQSLAANTTYQTELQQALEGRLNEFSSATKKRHDEMNTRLGRVVDEANVGIASAVESAARPILKTVEHRQDKVETDVKALDASIRKFDEQAGQMVTHINAVTTAIDARLERVSADVMSSFDERIAAMVIRIDEVSAAAARQQSEVSNIVGARVDTSEERTNERIVGLETRINEEVGQRVADIDAHVGRIGAGLDDAVITLNDRIAAADGRFTEVEAEFATIREDLGNVDVEAIDEMKDRVSSALGQAELVRIEMDRFKEEVDSTVEKTAVRLTEIETTVQDQNMDVETAVQLERLEEVERAVLMLDPDIIRSREDDDVADDQTVAMQRPAEASATPIIDRLEPPPATAPLAPPTAEPTINTTATSAPVEVDLSMSLDPPVSH